MPIDPIPYPTSTPGTDAPQSLPHDTSDDLVGRIAQSAHRTIDRLAESAGPHVRSLQDSFAGGGDSMHSRADQMREMSDEWTETLRLTVRDHPLASLGVALAVGMLVARVTR